MFPISAIPSTFEPGIGGIDTSISIPISNYCVVKIKNKTINIQNYTELFVYLLSFYFYFLFLPHSSWIGIDIGLCDPVSVMCVCCVCVNIP